MDLLQGRMSRLVSAVGLVGLAILTAACPSRKVTSREELELRNRLVVMRMVIREYRHDKAHGPQSLDDLVRDGYLREIPIDPITRNNRTWTVIRNSSGICGIVSGSHRTGSDGKPYSAM